MNKSFYKKSIMAMLFVLIYIAASTAFAQILPLPVLQDLTNSNIERRILYDAIQAAAVIPFAVTYFRDTAFRKIKISSKWIPWGLIGVCAILVTIILPERVYAFWFYLIIVGCGEEFVFRGYLHRELILDEPTSGLDGRNMRLIAERLKSEARNGRTILVITHDRELIESCCDNVAEIAAYPNSVSHGYFPSSSA